MRWPLVFRSTLDKALSDAAFLRGRIAKIREDNEADMAKLRSDKDSRIGVLHRRNKRNKRRGSR